MKMIPLIDLKKQYSLIENRIKERVCSVLDSGQYVMGPEVEALEKRLAEYVGVKHCITCSSGTDALVMSLMAKGIGEGDVVLTTPFTFIATAEAVSLLGATPVFVDVDPETFNIDVKKLELAIRALEEKDSEIYPLPDIALQADKKVKGIIAVDIFGLPSDYDEINKLADQYGLFVIEDAAQSFGAEYKGKKAGSLAGVGCTSFFPAKPLGCYGDGGAIFCDDDQLAEQLKSIRVHGQGSDKYQNVRVGLTARLDAMQAAIVDIKLDIFDEELEKRQRVTKKYEACLSESDIQCPVVGDGYLSAWAQYTLRAKDEAHRDNCVAALQRESVGHAIYYPIPLYKQKVYEYLGYQDSDFPVSYSLSKRVFSVPMHPYLADADIESVAKVIGG